MSAKDFLVNETYRFSNPRFYRTALKNLQKKHRILSRRKKGSKNRDKAILQLSRSQKGEDKLLKKMGRHTMLNILLE